jgi:hypothetical protein
VKKRAAMRHGNTIFSAFLLNALCFITVGNAQVSSTPGLQARLTLETEKLYEEGSYKVRIEIENVSDHVILVGRELSPISNWPFRIDIQLEDSSGKKYGPGGGGFVEFPQTVDFSSKGGLFTWWLPLSSHTFLGTHFTPRLAGVPAGKYKLHGIYIASPIPASAVRPSEPGPIPFEGELRTNSVWIEVLPRQRR